MADTPVSFADFAWRDIGDGFQFEFSNSEGRTLAEVTFEEDRGQRWSWSVTLPLEWQDGNGSPCGLASSADTAMFICKAILRSTLFND